MEAQMDLLHGIPSLIKDVEKNRELAKPIMEYKIRNAIWSLHADKVPRPNGFTINFYRAAWDIIKEDLKKMLNWTRKKDKIGGETNSSFLALIPKEKNPSTLDRSRPISLCNTSYKILSKNLASRMKSIMGRLISYS